MSPMANWPPKRGPNPHAVRVEFVPGEVVRRDVPRVQESPVAATERALIEEVESAPAELHPAALSEVVTNLAPRRKPLPLTGNWRFVGPGGGYHVETVAGLTLEQADRLLAARWAGGESTERRSGNWGDCEPATLSVVVDYPLRSGVDLLIPPMRILHRCAGPAPHLEWCPDPDTEGRAWQSPGHVLWTIAREYLRIYAEHERYGVWGHALSDLYVEGLEVDEHGVTRLLMGS